MRIRRGILFLLALLLLSAMAPSAWARGCLAAGTMVATPTGPLAVEKLNIGDAVWSIDADGLHRATVAGVFQISAPVMLDIRAGQADLHVTPEHPLQTDTGTFTEAGRLHTGDRLWTWKDDALQGVSIQSIRREQRPQPAYNLLVFPGGTYLADGFAVHNKGCFLPDTPIRKADGTETPIGDIRIGDRLAAFTPEGKLVTTTVLSIVKLDVQDYCRVTTDQVTLDVTEEHPFFVGDGTFKTLETLHVGDTIFAVADGRLMPQPILSIEQIHHPATVYNLQTDDPHTFFAHGIAVHNKGGHGGGGHFGGGGWGVHSSSYGYYGSSTRGSSDGGIGFLIFFLAIVAMIIVGNISNSAKSGSGGGGGGDLDYVHKRRNVEPKAEHTTRLLQHLATTDSAVDPDQLKEIARSTFISLEDCWQSREYEPMEPLLMPDLYHSHLAQLNAMIQQHEINHIDNLEVLNIDLVNVRYDQRPERREFTALITASARDYYTDDRTGAFLRGDDRPAQFQEFWIFHFVGGKWLLREIEQSQESDALRDRNTVDSMSDAEVEQVAGPHPETVHAPWADPACAAEAPRLEAKLAALAKADPMWDRATLQSRARDTFLAVLLAEEEGDVTQINPTDLTATAYGNVQSAIAARETAGQSIQFRNLCVRKVEIVLVQPRPGGAASQCMARISAHAQTILSRGDSIIQRDPYERPFVKYVTLEFADGKWKLHSIDRPPSSPSSAAAAETSAA